MSAGDQGGVEMRSAAPAAALVGGGDAGQAQASAAAAPAAAAGIPARKPTTATCKRADIIMICLLVLPIIGMFFAAGFLLPERNHGTCVNGTVPIGNTCVCPEEAQSAEGPTTPIEPGVFSGRTAGGALIFALFAFLAMSGGIGGGA